MESNRDSFISLCLIVRDEEPTLGRCLASFDGGYDELIVVDTGSQDRSVDIARSYGARIEYFEWRDDFSAARNYVCSLASGKWIVMVDGDEILAPEGIAPRLPHMLRQVPERLDKLLIEVRTLAEEDTVSLFADRIFRNLPRLTWRYRIHEVIETPPERTAKTRDFYLLHANGHKRGEQGNIGPEREAMYLRALALDMEEHPDDPRPAFYYAATLFGAGRSAEASRAFEHYFRLSEDREPVRRAVAFRDAAALAGRLGERRKQRSLLFRSLEHDWRSRETYRALSDAAAANSNLEEAVHWLRIALGCPQDELGMYWSSRSSRPALLTRLAELYRGAGQEEAARDCERHVRFASGKSDVLGLMEKRPMSQA